MDRFRIIFVALAISVPLGLAAYFYVTYPGEFDASPLDEAGLMWQPEEAEVEFVIDTRFSRAKVKAEGLRQKFGKEQYAEVESAIDAARAAGYTPWNQGSWQEFYYDHLKENRNAVVTQKDIDRAKLWIQHSPHSTYAHTYLGDLYVDQGWAARGGDFRSETAEKSFAQMREYFELAIAGIEHALELDPGNVYASRQLLRMARAGNFDIDPKQVFDRAVRHNPDHYYLYNTYLISLEPRWGGSTQAMFEFARKYSADKSPYPTLSRLITTAHENQARDRAQERARLDRPLDGVYFDRKVYRKAYYKYFRDEAVWQEYTAAFTTVFNAFPDYADALFRYAHNAKGSGRNQTALEYFERAIQADSAFISARNIFDFAEDLRAANHNAQASKYYRLYLERIPDHEDKVKAQTAADFVGWHYAIEGKYKASFPYYEIVAQLSPDSARSISNFCNAHFNIYQYDEGIKYCEQAIDIDPDHSWSYHILAEIYNRTGDAEKSQSYRKLYNQMTGQ